MDMSPQEYQAYIKQKSPRSPIVKDTALAFLIGGAICVLGQLILDGYRSLGLDKTDAGTATSVTLIFLAALTTGLNLYNSLARFAGAGTDIARAEGTDASSVRKSINRGLHQLKKYFEKI